MPASDLQTKNSQNGIVKKRTWITVVGVGVDLLIVLPIIDRDAWQRVAGIVAASSVGIITRNVVNEALEQAAE